MKLIVGLGNAGPKYTDTRHNIGFDVVEILARQAGIELNVEKFHACFGTGEISGQRVVLMKPTTLMNRSGQSVQAAGRFYKLQYCDILVVVDDLALPVGRLRMRSEGSAGGHNGLQDIIDRLGDDNWSRLRIGIGQPLGDASAYVLQRFSKKDEEIIRPACERAADAVRCWITDGPDLTMTRYNGEALDS